MPELPEIACRASEMDRALKEKTILQIEIVQPKCLNMAVNEFQTKLTGAVIKQTSYAGKWIKTLTSQGWILLNLGMGGEILLLDQQPLPEKHRVVFEFTDSSRLSINFWWFGYLHYAGVDQLQQHVPTAKLGPNALDFSPEQFHTLVKSQKGKVKAFLLDQTRIAGIGNAYIHDILFLARIHPLRQVASLNDSEISALYDGIRGGLIPSLEKGGAFYETNLFGEKGGFQMQDILIGYREGQPCPRCQTPITKIKTGGTSSFICSACQPE